MPVVQRATLEVLQRLCAAEGLITRALLLLSNPLLNEGATHECAHKSDRYACESWVVCKRFTEIPRVGVESARHDVVRTNDPDCQYGNYSPAVGYVCSQSASMAYISCACYYGVNFGSKT